MRLALPLLSPRIVSHGGLTRSFLVTGALSGVVLAVLLALLTGHETHSELFEERERALLLIECELARRGAPPGAAGLGGLREAFGLGSLVVLSEQGLVLAADPPGSGPVVAEALRAIAGATGPGEDHLLGGLDPPRYSELFGLGQRREGDLLRTTVPLRLPGGARGFLMGTQRIDDLLPEAVGAGLEVATYAVVGVGILIGLLALWIRQAEAIIRARTEALERQGQELALANAHLRELAGNLEGLVSDRTRRLLQAESLARLGRLSAGVAHEINNPLAAIATSAQMLLKDLEAPDFDPGDEELQADLRDYLALIRDEAFRVEGIARNLLDFSRSGVGRQGARVPLDLRELLEGTQRLLAHRAAAEEKAIEVKGGEGLTVVGDPHALRQLALNLSLNALHATQPGGLIRWSLAGDGDQVVLRCDDEGPGFSSEAIERALEPFYSEKAVGEGTGLGLSIVYGIVREHRGSLELENRPQGGASVRVTLPRSQEAL